MNNLKKVGLTALASSLVAVTAHAGDVSVSGGASMTVKNHTGNSDTSKGKTLKMGNQLTFTGGGELENGLTVGISFIIDQGDDSSASQGPFDSHSISVSSDTLGTLSMAGEGTNDAAGSIDTTAAGDIWNYTFTSFTTPLAASSASGTLKYTTPEITDGLTLVASLSPKGTATAGGTSVGYGINYTGIDGLTVNLATAENNSTALKEDEMNVMKASYAYGPVTIAASQNEYDAQNGTDAQEVSSYAISYTVSENISVSYGSETHEDDAASTPNDAEFTSYSASYTAGGMTISAIAIDAENVDFNSTVDDSEYWGLTASFAF
jgi:outer membrane protein OmpU